MRLFDANVPYGDSQVSKALEEKASEFLQQIQLMKATENELKSQLDSYGSKFEEFQGTLTKSNEVRHPE